MTGTAINVALVIAAQAEFGPSPKRLGDPGPGGRFWIDDPLAIRRAVRRTRRKTSFADIVRALDAHELRSFAGPIL